jgi:EmrB/QacA subfamily drug resistance transporter
MEATVSGTPQQELDKGTVMALVAMALAVFVVANDFTALSVALPNIEHDLDASVGTVQWVINAYALVFGVLIVTGGRLADILGRRRTFFIGAGIFAAFSVLAGLAPNVDTLIAGRALMAIGGAMMWPAVVGMTFAILPDDKAGLAGGLVLGVAGIGNAFGPMLGGVLTEEVSWRAILLLNLPIAAIACSVTYLKVKRDRPESTGERIDYAGVVTLSLALVALLVALDQVTDWGWTDPRVLGLIAVCVVGLIVFLPIERRAGRQALVPADVISNRSFTAACLATLFMSATFFSMLLYAPQFMQKMLDFSALEAGIGFLPLMGLFAVTSFVAGPLYNRVGARPLLLVGSVLIPAGALWLSLLDETSRYGAMVPGLGLIGIGVGLFYSTLTTAAITSLDKSRSSLGGGILYMFQVAGGSIGLGLTTTIFTSAAHDHVAADAVSDRLTTAQEHAVDQLLAGTDTAQQLTADFPHLADRLQELAREAFLAGIHAGFRLDFALALLALVIVAAFVRPTPSADRT